MILVIGGRASGKRDFARSLGYAPSQVAEDVQELVLNPESNVNDIARDLAASKEVVMFCEVGSGVVPMEREEREWRDRAGVLSQALAREADAVVRMSCGIPVPLKGRLPRTEIELVIMRHGSTAANERHAYAGATDIPLSALGEREALDVGVCDDVAMVYVSRLARARRTAELCFPQAEQVVVDGLEEMDFGDFEGRSADDMEQDEAYRSWVDGSCIGQCPNGESRADLKTRVVEAVHHIVSKALAQGEERVVVVAHGGTIMAAFDALSEDGRDYFAWQVGNCEGYRARAHLEGGAVVLDRMERFSTLAFLGGHLEPSSTFFQNRACAYFPCHEGVDERDFNCLLCYCPLYALGPGCGGNFTYTERGRKNCTGCALPHVRDNGVKLVSQRYEILAELASRPTVGIG